MPKKKPITKNEARLLATIKEGNTGLVNVKWALNGHFKKTDSVMVEIDDLYRRYSIFTEKATELIKSSSSQ